VHVQLVIVMVSGGAVTGNPRLTTGGDSTPVPARAHDLRRETRRIGIRPAFDALINRRRDEHDEARAEAHEHVRAKARRLAARLPLVADDAAEDARERQAHEYFPLGYHIASFQDGCS